MLSIDITVEAKHMNDTWFLGESDLSQIKWYFYHCMMITWRNRLVCIKITNLKHSIDYDDKRRIVDSQK